MIKSVCNYNCIYRSNALAIVVVLALLVMPSTSLILNAIKKTSLLHQLRSQSLRMSTKASTTVSLHTLDTFGSSAVNTFTQYLKCESSSDSSCNDDDGIRSKVANKQFVPRQIYHSHYTYVYPEQVPKPYMIASSSSCATELGLDPKELLTDTFLKVFSGNQLITGLDKPWASIYGCHCYGHWFGQLGDGRAMSLGEVVNPVTKERYELQLKGAGRTPFSRGFDGRAVVRSSIREYLVSEAMHALGVPTTRALSLVGTGMTIRRPWYSVSSEGDALGDESSSGNDRYNEDDKYQPNIILQEPGAITCRVAKSFLRIGQFELFAKRKEYDELAQFANYLCYREFPDLLHDTAATATGVDTSDSGLASLIKKVGKPERYVALFKQVTKKNAFLVSEWLRVGYTQGNMNSDNTLLAGRTMDYGPYGWLERFNPEYQPFTSDAEGKFCFLRQPNAMSVNILVLSKSMMELVRYSCNTNGVTDESIIHAYNKQIEDIADQDFESHFFTYYDDIKRRKLGFNAYDTSSDDKVYAAIEKLMYDSHCDFTIFWRELATVADMATPEDALMHIKETCMYDSSVGTNSRSKKVVDDDLWLGWLSMYLTRIQKECIPPLERKAMQHRTSPKYVLRNWMSILAYEKAAVGDYSVLHELNDVLSTPYCELSEEMHQRWYCKTPDWARGMPGAAFMS